MTCPSCGHEFPRYASIKLSPFTVIGCKQCGATLKRVNKLVPLLLAVGGILLFGVIQSEFDLTTGAKIVILGAIIWVVLLIDEATAKLAKTDVN